MANQLDEVLRDPVGAAEADDAFARRLDEGTMGERIRAFEAARIRAESGSKPRQVGRVRPPKRPKLGGRRK